MNRYLYLCFIDEKTWGIDISAKIRIYTKQSDSRAHGLSHSVIILNNILFLYFLLHLFFLVFLRIISTIIFSRTTLDKIENPFALHLQNSKLNVS